jgi:hypothetical protein
MPNRSRHWPNALVLLSLLAVVGCSSRFHPPAAVPPASCPGGKSATVMNGASRDVDFYVVTEPSSARTLVGTVPALSTATLPLPPTSTHVIVWWSGEPFPDGTPISGLWSTDHIYVRFECR